ncbi:cardiolipin synthase [Algimonas porphyrae]|uniref:Cardiolipin synthase n=1 Tax=Algimonas porphyrae TaxID=1128113 RepID=A0ABQ5UYS0_9PROT|nr:cardiolipin synthase [Algimonas porphyrae]GLQ20449.1 cardiolipin synthase A [Algimonas porphyrae]
MLPTSPLFLLAHIIVTVTLSLIIISRRINVATTLSWIVLLSVLPVVGAGLYFLFGSQSLGRKRMQTGWDIRQHYQRDFGIGKRRVSREDLPVDNYLQDLSWMLSIQTGFFPTAGNRYKLFTEAPPLVAAMIADIDAAQESVYLEFYIVDPDGLIIGILEALERAAERGIDTRLMVDDFGGRPFFKSDWDERLCRAGVDVVHSLSVNPIKALSKRTDLRNHRKLIVIDQEIGYTGSFNLTDPVKFKQGQGYGQWVDVMMRLEGHIVSSLSCVFNTDYIFDSQGMDYTKDDLRELSDDGDAAPHFEGGPVMQLVPSGPEMQRSVIHELMVSSIYAASDTITLVTPYFVPDDTIQLALINAAHRGVNVRLIVPRRVDSIMARHAGEATFDSLIQAGIEIHRFTGGMLHTKLVQVDNQMTLIGTANVDMRSFYLNLEMTLCVYDEDFAAETGRLIETYISESEMLDPQKWETRGPFLRWKENILRLASPLL